MEKKEKLQKFAAKMSTKYGKVIEGRHEGLIVGLGTDPSKTVSVSYEPPSQMVFFNDVPEEKARYVIADTFAKAEIIDKTEKGFKVSFLFADGDRFVMELEWKKEEGFIKTLFRNLLQGGNGIPNAKEKAKIKYHPIKTFMKSVIGLLTVDSLKYLKEFYISNDILEDLDEKLIDKCLEFKTKA